MLAIYGRKMKQGYALWSIGWVCVGVGIALIVLGVISKTAFGIVKGLIVLAIAPAWFRWGKLGIQKAIVAQQQEKK